MHSPLPKNPQQQTMGDIESAQEALSEIPGAAQQTSSMDAGSSNPINPTSSNELEELDASQAEVVRNNRKRKHRRLKKEQIGFPESIDPSSHNWTKKPVDELNKIFVHSHKIEPYIEKVSREESLSDEEIQHIMQLYKVSTQEARNYKPTDNEKMDFSRFTDNILRFISKNKALAVNFFKQFILPFSKESRQSFLSSLPREKYPCAQKLVEAFISGFDSSFMKEVMQDPSATLTTASILFFKDYLDELNATVAQEYLERLRIRDLSLQDRALIRNALLPSIIKSRHSSDISIVDACLGFLDPRAKIEKPPEAPCLNMSILSLDRLISGLPNGHVFFTLLLRNALSQDEIQKVVPTDPEKHKAFIAKLLNYLTGLTKTLSENPVVQNWSLWIMLNYLSNFLSIKSELLDNKRKGIQLVILQQSGIDIEQGDPISFYLDLYKGMQDEYQTLKRNEREELQEKGKPLPSPEKLLLTDMKKVATATLHFTMMVYANNQAAKEYINVYPLPDPCSFEAIEAYCRTWVQHQGENLSKRIEKRTIQQMAPTHLFYAFYGKVPLRKKYFDHDLYQLANDVTSTGEEKNFTTLLAQIAGSASFNNAHSLLVRKLIPKSSILNTLAPALRLVSGNLAAWLCPQLPGLGNAVNNYPAVAIDDGFSDDESPIDERPAPSCGSTDVLSLLSMPVDMQRLAVGSINLYITLRDAPLSFDKEVYQRNQQAAINYIQEHQLAFDSVEAIKKCILAWPEQGESLKIDDRTRLIVVNQLCFDLAEINPALAEPENFNRLFELMEETANTITAQNAIIFYLDLFQELQQLTLQNTTRQTQSQPSAPGTTAPAATASAQEVPTPTPAITTDVHGASAATQGTSTTHLDMTEDMTDVHRLSIIENRIQDYEKKASSRDLIEGEHEEYKKLQAEVKILRAKTANSPEAHLAYKQEAHHNPTANEDNTPPPLPPKPGTTPALAGASAYPNPSVASTSGYSGSVPQQPEDTSPPAVASVFAHSNPSMASTSGHSESVSQQPDTLTPFEKALREQREAILQKRNAQPNPSVANASGPSRPAHQNNMSASPLELLLRNHLQDRRQNMTGKVNREDSTSSESSSDTDDDPQAWL
jgi:hypothetical protein